MFGPSRQAWLRSRKLKAAMLWADTRMPLKQIGETLDGVSYAAAYQLRNKGLAIIREDRSLWHLLSPNAIRIATSEGKVRRFV